MADATVGLLRVLLSADTAEFDKRMAGADASTKKLAATMKRDLEPSQTRINKLVREFAGSREIGMANDYAEAIKRAGGSATLTAQQQDRANQAIQRALAQYRALGQEAPKHLLDIEKATRRAEGTTTSLGGNMGMLAGKVRLLAGAFGITAGVAGIAQFAKSAFDAADQIVDLSDKMGVSIEAAQRFQFAARQAGADIDQVSKSIVQMNDRLANGDKSTITALKSAGLEFDTIRQMKPEDAFRAIADAIGRIPDPMKQTQVAMDLFGKSGAELLPMIRSNALAVADGMDVMSDTTARRLEEAKQNWENFWNGLTIKSASAIVTIMDQWNKFTSDFSKGFRFIAALISTGGNVTAALAFGQAEFEAARLLADQKLRQAIGKPLSSHGVRPTGRVETDEERKAREAYAKTIEDLADTLTGRDIDDRLKKLAAAVKSVGGESALTNPQLDKLGKELDQLYLDGVKLPAVLDKVRMSTRRMLEIGPLPKEFQAVAALMAQKPSDAVVWGWDFLNGFRPDLTPNQEAFDVQWGRDDIGGFTAESFFGRPAAAQTFADRFSASMQSVLESLPQMMLGAFQGGGNVGRSVGGLLGGGLVSELGKSVSSKLAGSFLGKGLGSALGSFIPGVGTLLGGAVGGLIDKVFGGEGRRVNDLRDQFMAAQGGLEGVHKTLAAFNNDPQLAAAFDKLYFTGDEGDFNAGMAAYEKRLKEIGSALTEAGGKIGSLTSQAEKFGGVLPKSLHAAAQQILGMSGLTGDLRKQLEALMGQPSWRVLEERASALGIDTAALGGGFNQAKVKDLALGYVRDIEMFKEAGADVDGVLRGMADEISTLLIEAQRTGAALPKTLEPYINRLGEMGLLLDQNGNAIELGAFSFADFEDEALEAMKDLLTEIKDILAKAFPAAASAAARSFRDLREAGRGALTPAFDAPDARTPGWSLPDLSYATSTPSFSPFVDPNQMVMGSDQMMTIVYQADGRDLTRTVMPYLAGETRRLGLAPR